MELELHRTQLAGYEMTLDTTISQEGTLELIVPDAYPDILRIIGTNASVRIHSKESQDGRAEISGTIHATAVYSPDGAEGLRRLELLIPFTCAADAPALRAGSPLILMPRVRAAETRMLNPRKVLVRADIAVAVQGWNPMSERICTELTSAEAVGLQQMQETHETYLVTSVQEKTFTFSDEVILSGSRPAAEELLDCRTEIRCNESKIIGNKLIFKGDVILCTLYRSAAGAVCTGRWELPFSQIMEVSGVEEDAECELQILLSRSDISIAPDGEEGRSLSVSLELLAQAVVREERSMTLVSDAYATDSKLHLDVKEYPLHRLVENNIGRHMVRELLDPGVEVRAVEDIYVHIGKIEAVREAEENVMTAETAVTVLFTGEDGELYSLTRQIPASARIALPEGTGCRFSSGLTDEVTAVPAAGGIEVRYTVEFRYLAVESRRITAVSGARAEPFPPRDPEQQPSITLRMMHRGERLWDIAKAYGTTIDALIHANDLGDSTDSDALLLIPQRR